MWDANFMQRAALKPVRHHMLCYARDLSINKLFSMPLT